METVGVTHVGNVRTVNEDTLMIECSNDPKYMLVADGMGGHAAGEIASKTAAQSIKDYINGLKETKLSEQQIRDAVEYANSKLLEDMQDNEQHKGMGTTLTFAHTDDSDIIIAQVGDSSAFLYDGEDIKKLTTDHTYVQHLIDSGVIKKNAAEDYPFKNIITRALGMKKLDVDVYQNKWEKDNILMLCSDGLTSYVKIERIKEIIAGSESIRKKADTLVEEALIAGGKDNITVIIASNDLGEVVADD